MDIIVTTPKKEMMVAAQEAEYIRKQGEGCYFRTLPKRPKDFNVGDRVFYTENGYVRGYAVAIHIVPVDCQSRLCETTNRYWHGAWCIYLDALTWTWVKPIPFKGFQGYRYFNTPVEIIGGWLDPKPEVL